MYTLPKAPSKIVANARRGPLRSIDFESYDSRDKSSTKTSLSPSDHSPEMSSHPRPTFQPRRPTSKKPPITNNQPDPALHENHQEMANLLLGQWKKVEGLLKGNRDEPLWEMYREKECDKNMEGIDPLDSPIDLQGLISTALETPGLQ